MMKQLKWYFLLVILIFTEVSLGQQSTRVKYAFLFIGDGMGLAQVNLAQAYLSSLEGQIGMNPLTFTEFPSVGLVSTYANNRETTCSAAAGTALATGHKTDINRISMSADKTEIYTSIAEKAKASGRRIGIVTSVSIDHATPAVFYAHQPDRNMYFEIGSQLVVSNFDYFAGGGFLDPVDTVNGKAIDLLEVAEDNGFYVMNDPEDFKELMKTRKKILMLAPRTADGASLPYALDEGPGDISLEVFTAKGIELLEGQEGFFMMVEGGKIDWACHANDAGTAIQEVLAFDRAILPALEFYQKHPEETLIVVTADHETGGLSLGNREMGYSTDLSLFQYQQSSVEKLNLVIGSLREKKTGKSEEDFEKLLQLLEEHLGLNSKKNNTLLTEEEKQSLKDLMMESLYGKGSDKGTYGDREPVVEAALGILATRAGIAWGTGAHSFIAVPVYAIGAGAEEFDGSIDNTDIAKKMERLMGLQ